MKTFRYTFLILIVLTCSLACRNFVEVDPTNTRILKYTSDYLGLMQNTTKFDVGYASPIYLGDDVGTLDIRWQNALNESSRNAYTWAADIYSANEDVNWSTFYSQILICNMVIQEIMDSEKGTEAQKTTVKSYALVHRAYIYLSLVNMYAKQYDASTASTDPGIPLRLESKLFTDLTRASVQKTYDQIIVDLNDALPGLNNLPDFNTNPSKAAAYALLARVYLNMRQFGEANKYAALALELRHELIDLNELLNLNGQVIAPSKLAKRMVNPEEIFFKKTNVVTNTYPLSTDAVNVYDQKDLRYVLFTRDGATVPGSNFTTRAYWRFKILNDGTYIGPNVPEMMLIRAECAARNNNPSGAVDILNALRTKRFKPAEYIALSAADANTALHLVIDERKREFVGRGFRWFDQRRLSKDPGFVGTVTRVFKDVTYTLENGANRYVFPIASKYISFNPEITQNPR